MVFSKNFCFICSDQSKLAAKYVVVNSGQSYSYSIPVADREMRECVDPEGNGVTMGGAGPPSGEPDQLICNSGGDKTFMGEQGGQPDGLDATSRNHYAQSM